MSWEITIKMPEEEGGVGHMPEFLWQRQMPLSQKPLL
jgi:hypothetical protein